ncbi:putative exonuclease [Syncephalis fuscata]|nr:putative exonuclease [Syncephalis fuscata]
MGISGLLPLLKSIQKPVHISALAGQCVAIDAYVWLHRGTYGCAAELGMSKPTRKYVDYCMHRVRLLKHFGVTPLLVFDGAPLPAKAVTEQERATRRAESLEKALQYQKTGQSRLAFEHFQRSLDVTPQLARQLIEALRKENIKYVVAPYEADAQLAYLSRTGVVDAIITEDSDLLVFGCSRKQVIFKMDQYGHGMEIRQEDLSSNRGISLVNWTSTDFRRWCILSGCDYLKSLPGMGLKRAHKYVTMYKTLEQMLNGVKKDGFPVNDEYRRLFKEAELTFLHQRVYDTANKQLAHLTELSPEVAKEDTLYLGPDLDKDLAIAIAIGDVDPTTKEPFKLTTQTKHATTIPFRPLTKVYGSPRRSTLSPRSTRVNA